MVALFVLVLGGYYAFAATELYRERVFHPYLVANAKLSGDILVGLGQEDVETRDASLFSSKFSLSIGRGCDGLQPMAMLVAVRPCQYGMSPENPFFSWVPVKRVTH